MIAVDGASAMRRYAASGASAPNRTTRSLRSGLRAEPQTKPLEAPMDTPYAFVAHIEAKPEKTDDVADLLTGALPLARPKPAPSRGTPHAPRRLLSGSRHIHQRRRQASARQRGDRSSAHGQRRRAARRAPRKSSPQTCSRQSNRKPDGSRSPASKAAAHSLTQSAANRFWRRQGSRSTGYNGGIDTDMLAGIDAPKHRQPRPPTRLHGLVADRKTFSRTPTPRQCPGSGGLTPKSFERVLAAVVQAA